MSYVSSYFLISLFLVYYFIFLYISCGGYPSAFYCTFTLSYRIVFYCQIRSEWLLYDTERDLLAIAKFYVLLKLTADVGCDNFRFDHLLESMLCFASIVFMPPQVFWSGGYCVLGERYYVTFAVANPSVKSCHYVRANIKIMDSSTRRAAQASQLHTCCGGGIVWPQAVFSSLHCESKKLDIFSLEHNFGKYCPILIILSLLQTEIHYDKVYHKIYHHNSNLLVHYLVK